MLLCWNITNSTLKGYEFIKIHLQDQITSGRPTVDWKFIDKDVKLEGLKTINKLRVSVGHDFGYEDKFLVIEQSITADNFPAFVHKFQGIAAKSSLSLQKTFYLRRGTKVHERCQRGKRWVVSTTNGQHRLLLRLRFGWVRLLLIVRIRLLQGG